MAENTPIPLVERWAQDDMKGVKIYKSIEEYRKAKRAKKKKADERRITEEQPSRIVDTGHGTFVKKDK